jgi:glucosamine--fructose-6-phosphate aminotransferase (isomerizing)
MCGIVGTITSEKGVQTDHYTLNLLKNLEYRGYDSFGFVNEHMNLQKFLGAISRTKVERSHFSDHSSITIAHTRWATHGKVTLENTHPHLSAANDFAVVHNGVISNYKELKDRLQSQGVNFKSSTDTEVIPNVIAQIHKDHPNSDPQSIIEKTISELKGEFAFLVISSHWPNTIVCVKNKSPLVIGVGSKSCVISSDENALASDFEECVHLQDKEIVTIENVLSDIHIHSSKSENFYKRVCRITASNDDPDKDGFPDFMSKEMYEIPRAIIRACEVEIPETQVFENKRVLLSGCGSAYYASWIGQNIRFSLTPRSYTLACPADELAHSIALSSFDAVIFISQSGETYDVLKPLNEMDKSTITACVTNVKGSSLSKSVEFPVIQNAGPERCVLSTKSIISQCSILFRLFSGNTSLLRDLSTQWVNTFHDFTFQDKVKAITRRFIHKDHYFHIGRGILHPVAMENALKLKEVTYCHAEGMGAGFFKHGTLSLIDDRFVVFAHIPSKTHNPEIYDLTEANISEIEARGGCVIRVGHESSHDFTLPDLTPELNALLHLGFGQYYAYHKAVMLNRDIDQPRSLAKSVTVR